MSIMIPDAFVVHGRGDSFKDLCCEDKYLALNDGGSTIFLNMYGKNHDVTPVS